MAAMKDILQLVSRSATYRSHSEPALPYRANLIILKGGSVLRVCRRQMEHRIEYHLPEQNSEIKGVYLYITSIMCVYINCLDQNLCLLREYLAKSSHCHMFRHYRVILWEFVINTLPSYTRTSNAAVDNTVYN
jgi:hypothetical protein